MKTEFQQWILSDKGQAFLSIELNRLESIYPLLVGSMGLQVSLSSHHDLIKHANLSERIHVLKNIDAMHSFNSININASKSKSTVTCNSVSSVNLSNVVIAESHELPFPNNEFAVVAAPHILELSTEPQATLRELYRVTAPEGSLLITGINPFSLFGVRCKFPFQSESIKQSFISLSKLQDWLKLLGFEVVAGNYFQYSCLLFSEYEKQNPKKQRFATFMHNFMETAGDRWFPSTAGAYAVVAKKSILGGTLVGKTKKERRRRIVGVKPVTNRVNRVNNTNDKQP